MQSLIIWEPNRKFNDDLARLMQYIKPGQQVDGNTARLRLAHSMEQSEAKAIRSGQSVVVLRVAPAGVMECMKENDLHGRDGLYTALVILAKSIREL